MVLLLRPLDLGMPIFEHIVPCRPLNLFYIVFEVPSRAVLFFPTQVMNDCTVRKNPRIKERSSEISRRGLGPLPVQAWDIAENGFISSPTILRQP